MKDEFLDIVTEFAQLEKRRREILRELPGLDSYELEALLRHSTLRRNMLGDIRRLLSSEPTREFPAMEIKSRLRVSARQEKSFYSALAKLHRAGQIRRVGRALYKGIPLRKKVSKSNLRQSPKPPQ